MDSPKRPGSTLGKPKSRSPSPHAPLTNGKPAHAPSHFHRPSLETILALLVAASLALHVPTYYKLVSDPGSLLAISRAPAAFGIPFLSGSRPTTPAKATVAKRFGDPDDDLLGEPFDGPADYVCDTSFSGVHILNRDPLMMAIDGFLRKGEAEWIVDKAKPLMARSSVVDVDDQPREKRNDSSEYRTSTSAFFDRRVDPILHCIEKRAVAFSGVPLENTEGLQVVHYQPGQYYKPHWDYFPREFASMQEQLRRGGQRVTTFFVYLNDVALPPGVARDALPKPMSPTKEPLIGAGSTQFPNVGIEVMPRKGRAAFWWDVTIDGKDDERTLHAGTPPTHGEKWGLNIWQREESFF
ncbi:hypothetical protein M427DRAFT_136310 [Gonapodya prolifera JEL478]|uniref:Fe2OG dioxygenase domain-containing protein n=1 Tax=Gonapodya prolifera (strain JEL478) TaxID=1344416 RepID=A0A139AAE6_GONPJ|nr:hypothetical protein M427DRAFT_136310 [Gonapodya prolifera JEL478]|eukprot:KXS13707.1 hypothetical protein M427DRAFT_136310 [Gonapodya prolifera JEL478]